MLFKSGLFAAAVVLSVHGVRGAPVQAPEDGSDSTSVTLETLSLPLDVSTDKVPLDVKIAVNPFYACNGPNNANHRAGDSCKYVGGSSSNDKTVSGRCGYYTNGGALYCIP